MLLLLFFVVGYVKASFPYNAGREDELSFACGDYIAVLRKTEGGWWRGSCNGKVGLFPQNRIKELELESLATATVKFNFNARRRDELTIAKGEEVEIMKLRNKNWFLVKYENAVGNFPACYLQYDAALQAQIPTAAKPAKPTAGAAAAAAAVAKAAPPATAPLAVPSPSRVAAAATAADATPPTGSPASGGPPKAIGRLPSMGRFGSPGPASSATTPTGAAAIPSPLATPSAASAPPAAAAPPPVMPRPPPPAEPQPKKQCQVLYDYEARYPNELTISKGDIIDIISQTGNWWEGELNGQRGQFPNNYVQLL